MKSLTTALILTAAGLAPLSIALAKHSKVQEVNFEEMMMKGAIRNPDGSFLVQKKGLKFYPLHEVQKDMDGRIREAEPEEVLVPVRRKR
ncbi:MAG: hypothetical protein C5B49_15130 [Bdellovibrio sp.]|nr:MAG: hypothetical protein C5B49_15130 [Bdellovibrio sp.]